ncbi:LysE family translocator [Variovorax sp. EL159]|uniref:LysE family translocator n=1 Tax=Variovorax sp. EL159 TaxID=1566270 RepID=UPI00088A3B2E|nr:LysE family translocator [Variovorax sp. EL159]SCX68816.1 Threonine/homoserine/homoserine lactone efflux protein [Variovorax sp. EL159]
MHLSNWLIFCGVTLLVAFTPGPAVLLAVSNSISVGPRRAMISSLGNAMGLFMVSAAAMAGLGVVLTTSAHAFMALKLAGAAYLIYLGIKQWRSRGSVFSDLSPSAAVGANRSSSWRLFGHGVTVALTNPKGILFFSALFPQFLTQDAPILEQFAVLTTTFAVGSVLSHAFYVLLARMLKKQLGDPRRSRMFNRVSGGAFVLLGLSLLRLPNKAA